MPSELKRPAEAEAGQVVTKKRRRRPKREDNRQLDLENSINLCFSNLDSQLLADYYSRMAARSTANLTSAELSDLSLPGE